MLPWGTCDSKVLKGGTFELQEFRWFYSTVEDYTLKHVWGLRTSTVQRIYKDSDPDQGSRRNLHNSLRTYA